MKVLLVYPNIVESPKDISIGLALISAVLKKAGHEVALLDASFGLKDEDVVKKVKDFNPGLVGVSAATNDLKYAISLAKLIKKNSNAPIVCGGYHTTVAAEDIIKEDCFDIAAIGEGEYSFLELADSLEKGKLDTSIKNMWFKQGKDVIKNPLRELNKELDKLPFPDRELFDYQRYINYNRGLATFLSTKGCPFQCTYCINATLMRMFGTKNYVRFRSVDNLLTEIKEVITKYKAKEIEFYDDTFTLDKERIKEFCKKYPTEIGLPFYINARVNTVDKDMLIMLKKAGCVRASIGIESGDPHIRNSVLKRNQTDEQIINTFRWSKEAGLETYSFNMIGIPFETKESIKKTIELNIKCNPDYVGVSIFNAFKGTELYEECKKNDWLNDEDSTSYFQSSNIKHPNFGLMELKKIRDSFGFKVFKRTRPMRAYVDLFDKKFIKFPGYMFIRSKLIKSGIKRILKK
ncbi:B12-binding domain-containing radical SAM protein [Nanoarchaeota archaeon]